MTLADRLRQARHDAFVGRAEEVARFEAALAAESPLHVLHVVGPGGIGKTTLLGAFERACRRRGVPVRLLDARDVEPTPAGFLRALGLAPATLLTDGDGAARPLLPAATDVAWTLADEAEPASAEAAPTVPGPAGRAQTPVAATRHVLLVDHVEAVAALDPWLRETFLPQAPASLLVVLAGRARPAAPWRTDPGWRALAAEMPLRNLAPDEARALLAAHGVTGPRAEAALAFTQGHPLALALVAENGPLAPDDGPAPEATPDVVGALLRRMVDDVPDDRHRRALEACAVARVTTESLLTALLGEAEAPTLFAWLRARPFVQEAREGLVPHDLVRDLLVRDLRWRHPERYADLHARVREHYTRRLQAATPEEQQRLLADYAFLYRDNPVAGPLIEQLREAWREGTVRSGGPQAGGPPRPDEWPALQAMIEAHEGPEAARLAAYWFARQPEGVEVFHDAAGVPVGFLARVALERLAPEDLAADAVVAAAEEAVRRAAPLREGERALLFRFWTDRDGHQAVSAVQSLIFARTVWHYLTTPGLAYSVLLCAAPHGWTPILAFAGLHRLPQADAETGGQPYEAFGHDWRVEGPEAWLAALAARVPDGAVPRPEAAEPALVVLSRPAFAEAVKDALKGYAQPVRLRGNPLLRSRAVAERAGSGDEAERIEALRALIDEAAQALEATPREEAWGRVLRLTFLRPAPSQAIAAERLELPFSTFRRYLGRGVEHVVETLWAREVG